jgi:pyrimidine deaminase RibD-like protein
MTTLAILPDMPGATTGGNFHAVCGKRHAEGSSAGAALDALTKQMGDQETAAVILVQTMKPDSHFNETQQARLLEIMEKWRNSARDNDFEDAVRGVDEELAATINRAELLTGKSA